MRANGVEALTPEPAVAFLRPYRGLLDILLMGRPPMDRRSLELLASEVAPALRAL